MVRRGADSGGADERISPKIPMTLMPEEMVVIDKIRSEPFFVAQRDHDATTEP